ncbi:MAG TPA: crossover junction endodeoxyribonuclease RuvC [Longimicrobiales bacterium]|nr:crossover junction endodeoxyribonuclease RuvC [Longimicrobiales bacterium]
MKDDGTRRILGIDPGTAITGFGVVERRSDRSVRLLECGVIRTSAGELLSDRIREVHDGVVDLIDRHRPHVMSVEDVFQGKNVRSALTLGHARGVIMLAGSLAGVAIAEYTPAEIKKAVVGRGSATKQQVGFMVMKQLRLKEAPTPADAADGVAAALCHCLKGSFLRER